MSGGDFCTTQPANFVTDQVSSFGVGSTSIAFASETAFIATAVASRITFTYTASSVASPVAPPPPSIPFGCVAEPSLIPDACSSAIAGAKIYNTAQYDKAALQTLIADEIDHFSTLENLSATGSCYNAFVKEACLLRVPRCNATNAILYDACFEQCVVRLNAAGCTSREPATPLHYCSLLPFCPVENRIPIATYVGPVVDRNQAPATVQIPPTSTGPAPSSSGTAPSASGSTPSASGSAPSSSSTPTAPGAPAAANTPRAASPKISDAVANFRPALFACVAFALFSLLF
jgi:hypothetical protein